MEELFPWFAPWVSLLITCSSGVAGGVAALASWTVLS